MWATHNICGKTHTQQNNQQSWKFILLILFAVGAHIYIYYFLTRKFCVCRLFAFETLYPRLSSCISRTNSFTENPGSIAVIRAISSGSIQVVVTIIKLTSTMFFFGIGRLILRSPLWATFSLLIFKFNFCSFWGFDIIHMPWNQVLLGSVYCWFAQRPSQLISAGWVHQKISKPSCTKNTSAFEDFLSRLVFFLETKTWGISNELRCEDNHAMDSAVKIAKQCIQLWK